MKNRTVRPANVANVGRFQASGKSPWLVSLALAPVMAIVVYGFFPSPPPTRLPEQVMDQTLGAAGFNPLIPPMEFREPGSLYAVQNNRSYYKVCDPDPKALEQVKRTSNTVEYEVARLTNARFDVTGGLADKLVAALGGEVIVSVTFKLSRVRIVEVNGKDLVALQRSMLTEPDCQTAVTDYQEGNIPVCIGVQSLKATAVYKVETKASLGADAREKIKSALENSVGSSFQLSGKDEFVGADLLYGIKLHIRCVAPRTGKDEIRPPPPTAGFSAKS